MFGRAKSEQSPAGAVTAPDEIVRETGKGRPTPRRKEAEQRNHRPIVGGQRVSENASKAERKAARAAQRAAVSAERTQARQALITGDERHLPVRDRGPARRWARDYVDARFNLGEYFIVLAFPLFALGLLPAFKLVTAVALYTAVLAVAFDCFMLRRRVKRMTETRFGDKAHGVGGYAMMRALQIRRTRLPRPQVARGAYPE